MSCCCFGGKGDNVFHFIYIYLLKDFPHDITNSPTSLVFCYNTWMHSKETGYIKLQRLCGSRPPRTKHILKYCKGTPWTHSPQVTGKEHLPTSRYTCELHQTSKETKYIISKWSFTFLLLVFKSSFSIIMKSASIGFSSDVYSLNTIHFYIWHSICFFINMCIHLNSLKLQPWKWILKNCFQFLCHRVSVYILFWKTGKLQRTGLEPKISITEYTLEV